MKNIIKHAHPNRLAFPFIIAIGLLILVSLPADAQPKKSPEKIKAIMVGDRVVDVSFNLGVLPEAMSVRCSIWPMCKQLLNASQVLGCPRCIVDRIPNIVPDTAKERGIKRIIIEKHPNFCIYNPNMKPANVVALLKGKDLTIEYVDFSVGLEEAIRQTASLLKRETEGEALIEKYRKDLAEAKAALPASASGKKVIIFNGIYQHATGKVMLRVEAPGGYADRFLLEPMGCVNVGRAFNSANAKAVGGHYQVAKSKGRVVLDPLIRANPDIIVMTGDAFAVQKAIAEALRSTPALLDVPAIKAHALFSLPAYVDSSVVEYPQILRLWANALSE